MLHAHEFGDLKLSTSGLIRCASRQINVCHCCRSHSVILHITTTGRAWYHFVLSPGSRCIIAAAVEVFLPGVHAACLMPWMHCYFLTCCVKLIAWLSHRRCDTVSWWFVVLLRASHGCMRLLALGCEPESANLWLHGGVYVALV